jgi:ATP-dependent Lon protease
VRFILGDLSIEGNVKAVRTLAEPLQVQHGQRRSSRASAVGKQRKFLEVSGEIVQRFDPEFFSDQTMAAMKTLGIPCAPSEACIPHKHGRSA